MLKQNRLFSLGFRIVAFLLCLAGMVVGCFHNGKFILTQLLYYTFQSNILVFIYFGAVILKTIADIGKNGKKGSSSYFERISGAVMIAISVTMLVYWTMLVPAAFSMSADMSDFPLFGFANLQLHLITPLLMIADYIFFTTRGKLKKYDPWLFTLIPIAYLIQATIVGFSGYVYRIDPVSGEATHFPYFFIDYYQSGWMVAVYVVVITAFFVGISYFILYLDRKKIKN
ncbi:MAG: Pr6Pr family membrane protein [Clostridiales bacterium]|jgi:hypothetical protein|nr:Pr6Pr family membrane protein [Clostridiales bacterium]